MWMRKLMRKMNWVWVTWTWLKKTKNTNTRTTTRTKKDKKGNNKIWKLVCVYICVCDLSGISFFNTNFSRPSCIQTFTKPFPHFDCVLLWTDLITFFFSTSFFFISSSSPSFPSAEIHSHKQAMMAEMTTGISTMESRGKEKTK